MHVQVISKDNLFCFLRHSVVWVTSVFLVHWLFLVVSGWWNGLGHFLLSLCGLFMFRYFISQILNNFHSSFTDTLNTQQYKNVKCKNDYSVQNDKSLHGHCTNERKVRKQDKKVRRDEI